MNRQSFGSTRSTKETHKSKTELPTTQQWPGNEEKIIKKEARHNKQVGRARTRPNKHTAPSNLSGKTHSEQRHRKVHKGVGADERRKPQDNMRQELRENGRRHVEA